MEAESNSCLTGYQITRLASQTRTYDMETMAERFMDISYETIKNLRYENRDNPEAFKRSLTRYWARKKSGPEQVQVREQEKF